MCAAYDRGWDDYLSRQSKTHAPLANLTFHASARSEALIVTRTPQPCIYQNMYKSYNHWLGIAGLGLLRH